jgi:hypothetical protein
MTLQEGLLQSVSARPGESEVLHVFPAWPKEWEASFRLLARGGFLVTAAARNGEVEFVEVESRRGETCRLRNPWGQPGVVTEAGDAAAGTVGLPSLSLPPGGESGDLLVFDTVPGGRYRVLPQDAAEPARRRIAPPAPTEPARFQWALPDGKVVSGRLGKEP